VRLSFIVTALVGVVLTSCGGDDAPGAGRANAPAAEDTAPSAGAGSPTLAETSQAIHRAALTLDTHVDIPFDFATDAVDPLDGDLQVNLQTMVSGGLDAAFFIVYVGQTERTPENYAQAAADAMTKFDAIHRMTDALYPRRIGLAYTADQMTALVDDGKLAAAIGIENGYVIGKDLAMLDRYYELGARYVTLVHNGHNDLADSAQPRDQLGDAPSEHGGISELGAEAIARMNDLGIMVDVSHASKESAIAAMLQSRAPVIASHSGVRALADHPRNMDGETLQMLADNGGVIQVVAFDAYVKVQPPERRQAVDELSDTLGLSGFVDPNDLAGEQRSAYLAGMREIDERWPPATVSDLVDHIDYAVELIGIDHVGISSDFGGGGGVVGWNGALETPNVTAELVERGYSREEIEKIWSGNLLRVWREVERLAAAPP
jgi:membrane dipeptidase